MKNLTKPDYETVMTFLAETPVQTLVHLAQSPARLDSYLLTNYKPKETEQIAPDSQEANNAATASGETDDRAEEKIYLLLKTQPKTWQAIKEAVHRVSVGDGIAEFLDRYHPPEPQPSESDQQ